MADQNGQAFNPNAPYQAATTSPATVTSTQSQGAAFDPNASYSPAPPPDSTPNSIDSMTGEVPPTSFTPTETEAGKSFGNTIAARAIEHPVDTAIGLVKGIVGQNPAVQTVETFAPLLKSYEDARSSGKSIVDSVKEAAVQAEKQDATTQAIKTAADNFKKNPGGTTLRTLMTAAMDAGTLYGVGQVAFGTAPVAADIPESEGIPTPQEPATPTPNTQIATTNPIDATVSKNVAKANLPAGEDVAADASGYLDREVKNVIHQTALDNDVPVPADGSVQDMSQEVADSIYNRSKAAYKSIDNATGGKFQPNADAIANVNQKLQDITGTNDEMESNLIARKQALELQQDKIFDEASANGVSRNLLNEARSDFRTSQAQYDLTRQLRMSAPTNNPDILDATKLRNRLSKLDVPGPGGTASRLEQAIGQDKATLLQDHASTAQFALNTPPTESLALKQLIAKNTRTSLLGGGQTNWSDTLKDFDNLGSQGQKAQFPTSSENVRNFLQRQALKNAIGGKGLTVLKHGVGYALGVGALNELRKLVFSSKK